MSCNSSHLLETCSILYLNIYISSVHMLVDKLLLNGSTDFDEIFCVSSGGFHNGLDCNSVQLKLFI